ncbi:MAG: DinB family protein [Bacteroidia bacterium]
MGLAATSRPEDWARELIAFQAWRREKVSELLRAVDETVFSQQINGSFGSLYIILDHMIWAEKVWLGRVDRNAVATAKGTNVLGLLDNWREVNEKWTAVVQAADTDAILREIEYFTSTGDGFKNTVLEIVIHMVDHSTYHVGQMMNAIRGFGIEPVSTNYIHYLRAKGS